jgi:hypothetical protein
LVVIFVFDSIAAFTRTLTPAVLGFQFELVFELEFKIVFEIVLESVSVVVAALRRRSVARANTIALHNPIPVNSARSPIRTPTFISVAIASGVTTSWSFSPFFFSRGEATVAAVAVVAVVAAAVAVINNDFVIAASICRE